MKVLRPEHSTTLFGEHGSDGRLLVAEDSLRAPAELFTLAADGSSAVQLTHFNRARVAGMALGRVGEMLCTGPSGDEIQSCQPPHPTPSFTVLTHCSLQQQ